MNISRKTKFFIVLSAIVALLGWGGFLQRQVGVDLHHGKLVGRVHYFQSSLVEWIIYDFDATTTGDCPEIVLEDQYLYYYLYNKLTGGYLGHSWGEDVLFAIHAWRAAEMDYQRMGMKDSVLTRAISKRQKILFLEGMCKKDLRAYTFLMDSHFFEKAFMEKNEPTGAKNGAGQ